MATENTVDALIASGIVSIHNRATAIAIMQACNTPVSLCCTCSRLIPNKANNCNICDGLCCQACTGECTWGNKYKRLATEVPRIKRHAMDNMIAHNIGTFAHQSDMLEQTFRCTLLQYAEAALFACENHTSERARTHVRVVAKTIDTCLEIAEHILEIEKSIDAFRVRIYPQQRSLTRILDKVRTKLVNMITKLTNGDDDATPEDT